MKDDMLEYRMYGFVPYNISSIQQGIQYGHALQELNNEVMYGELDEDFIKTFTKWRLIDKTFIILNGGTTNNNKESKWHGNMNQHLDFIKSLGIIVGEFYEPDLGDQLTGFCFLVDERVFDKKKYPDLNIWLIENHPGEFDAKFNKSSIDISMPDEIQKEWEQIIGGEVNVKLREFLSNKKLA